MPLLDLCLTTHELLASGRRCLENAEATWDDGVYSTEGVSS